MLLEISLSNLLSAVRAQVTRSKNRISSALRYICRAQREMVKTSDGRLPHSTMIFTKRCVPRAVRKTIVFKCEQYNDYQERTQGNNRRNANLSARVKAGRVVWRSGAFRFSSVRRDGISGSLPSPETGNHRRMPRNTCVCRYICYNPEEPENDVSGSVVF